MYRIEVKPGEEAVFRTIEELATGIRNGFITPRARIYHAASQKWLPIEFHPHYKKALEGNFTPATPAPQPSLASMPAPTFNFPGASAPGQGPALTQRQAASPEPEAAPAPAFDAETPAPAAPITPTAPIARTAPANPRLPWAKPTTTEESPVLAMQATVSHPPTSESEPDAGPVERYSPVAVREAPRPVPAPAPAPAPEIVLPNITYPELPAAEHTEHRAPARRSRRTAGRPLLLVGSAAVLVFAGQRFLASRAAASSELAPVTESMASEPTPAESPHAAGSASAAPGTARPATPATPSPVRAAPPAPARPAPVASQSLVPPPSRPMTPGPAFAASVPTRVTPGSLLPGSAPIPAASTPAPAPPAAPRPDSTAIAPAPTSIELDVPSVLPGESIAPSLNQGRDSLAIKRILKAVTGRKANPTAP